MKVSCHTNLDLRGERWPVSLPCLPNIGDKIQSITVWDNGFQLELEVVGITWKLSNNEWVPHIELHKQRHRKQSIREFYEWYAPLVGSTVSSFI